MSSAPRLPRLRSLLFWTALALILLASSLIYCYRIAEPVWEKRHHGYYTSDFHHHALNFLRFGYLDTTMLMVWNFGPEKNPDGFDFRVDAPPSVPLLISVFYRVFGVHVWSARLPFVIVTLATAFLTFVLARNLVGNRWSALLALGFAAFSPMQVFHARVPSGNAIASLSAIAAFLLYWRWFETSRRDYLVGFGSTLAVGFFSYWPFYFVVLPIVLHCAFFKGVRSNRRFLFALVLSPSIAFSIFLIWASFADPNAASILWDKLLLRSLSIDANEINQIRVLTVETVWSGFYERFRDLFTMVVFLLSFAALVGCLWALLHRRLSPRNGLVLALFFYAIGHHVVLVNVAFIHPVESLMFVPVFAIAAALAVTWLVSSFHARAPALVSLLVLATCCLFADQAVGNLRRLHHDNVRHLHEVRVGDLLNRTVSAHGRYVNAAHDTHPTGLDHRTFVIADRPYDNATTLDGMSALLGRDPTYEAVVVDNSGRTDPEMRAYLVEHHPRVEVLGFSVFDLTQSRSNVLVEGPDSAREPQVQFGSILEYLGTDLQPVKCQQIDLPGRLPKYLNRHPELLPKNRVTFHAVNYWRKLRESPVDLRLVTRFETEVGPRYELTPSEAGLDDLYPTSMWPVGEVVREAFDVVIPPDYPAMRYRMWVGVDSMSRALGADPIGAGTTRNDRALVASVDVRPARLPLGLDELPLTRASAPMNFGVVQLLTHDTDVTRNGIRVVTYWRTDDDVEIDHEFLIRLRDETQTLDRRIGVATPRLWQTQKVYRGDAVFPADLLAGHRFDAYIVARNEEGVVNEHHLTEVSWDNSDRRRIVRRIGQPDGLPATGQKLSPTRPWSMAFELAHRQDVELLIGWTGRSEFDRTRVEVSAHNPHWRWSKDRRLQTLVVDSGPSHITRVRLPRRLTWVGRNTVHVQVPERTHVGWRRILATTIPDLAPVLSTGYLPSSGWIELDFAQASIFGPPSPSEATAEPPEPPVASQNSRQRHALTQW